jgi:hypothetical protein
VVIPVTFGRREPVLSLHHRPMSLRRKSGTKTTQCRYTGLSTDGKIFVLVSIRGDDEVVVYPN